MTARELRVTICGATAGTIEQDSSGAHSFSYDPTYDAIPLSCSMPLANRRYGDKVVTPYLQGLLPDDPSVRQAMGREYGVSGNNPFSLLEHMGLDCPGAVQFHTMGSGDGADDAPTAYEPISDAQIAQRLHDLSQGTAPTWALDDEHWSLGGQQAKIALALRDGRWYRCMGSAATTHIIKPGIPSLKHQALNEYLCLRTASACGVPAEKVDFQLFDGEPAIVSARYDRTIAPDGSVLRLHQEDCCQALGVLPENKYASEGGPSARDVIALLRRVDTPPNTAETFAAMLFFNYLVGAPDAHAKNYSLLLGTHGHVALAPLYDVASGLAYDSPRTGWHVAMGIGGETTVGRIGDGEVRRFAHTNGLDENSCLDLMANLAKRVTQEIGTIFDQASGIPGTDELRNRMEPGIIRVCKQTLDRL